MPQLPRAVTPARLLTPVAAALLLAGCASLAPGGRSVASAGSAAAPIGAQPPVAASVAASAPAGTATPAARPDPAAPKPFAEVIKGAERVDGYLPVWRKDDKVWLEIAPARLGAPMLLSLAVANSIGERGLYGSQMGRDLLAEWRLVGRSVQLVARNMAYRADGDAPMSRTVRQSFSDSLLASAPVASAPHAERQSVLVDASFLLTDLQGLSTALESAFRLPYGLDRANSQIESVRATEHGTVLHTQLHFATGRIPAPPASSPPPGATLPTPPRSVPDPRSFFIGMVLNFAALPATPMAPRRADPRLGHFTEAFVDLSDDVRPDQRRHYVQRWRLEKQDPQADLSDPVRPITFWLDRNIPQKYRPAVEAGVLEWNKAFERIGFRNAIVVRQQPDDADFDTLDAQHASIRWFTGADVGFARGPSATDPRSGEILDADIAMSPVFARGARRFITEDLGAPPAASAAPVTALGLGDGHDAACRYAEDASHELSFALDLLDARGDLDPESAEAESFVNAYIQDTITHEVGHTLGLKHNFRASTVVTRSQLRDKGFTDSHPIAGSVMDYNPFNVPLAGETRTELNMRSLGPYDYWAIEYAYRPLKPEEESTALAGIAARSGEPLLAYGDDADADGFGGWRGGIDPRDNRFDLGDDPLAWAEKRIELSRELWQRVQARGALPGDDPQRLRRSLSAGFRQLQRLPEMAAKYVGGMYTERDLPGAGRPTYRPVEPQKQRAALQFLTSGFFALDSFRFEPRFLTRLGTDYNEWDRASPVSVSSAVLALQTQALDRLLAPGTAQRLLELPYYLEPRERRGAITLDEVYGTLQSSIWSELKSGADVDPLRRNLQREHLRRLQALLTRGAPGLPADALSLARMHATALRADLRRATARTGRSVETRAHLQDSLGLLTEALRATMQRS